MGIFSSIRSYILSAPDPNRNAQLLPPTDTSRPWEIKEFLYLLTITAFTFIPLNLIRSELGGIEKRRMEKKCQCRNFLMNQKVFLFSINVCFWPKYQYSAFPGQINCNSPSKLAGNPVKEIKPQYKIKVQSLLRRDRLELIHVLSIFHIL